MQRNHPAQPDADNINIHENKKHNDCSVKHKWKVAPTSQNQYASDGSTFVWIFYQTSKLSPQDEVFGNFLINAPKLLVSVAPVLLVSVSRGRARSEYRAIRICRYILLFSFDLCWVEAEHSHASPPTQTPIYMFYLCLCWLHCSSLPKLPILLFSLLLDGKPF